MLLVCDINHVQTEMCTHFKIMQHAFVTQYVHSMPYIRYKIYLTEDCFLLQLGGRRYTGAQKIIRLDHVPDGFYMQLRELLSVGSGESGSQAWHLNLVMANKTVLFSSTVHVSIGAHDAANPLFCPAIEQYVTLTSLDLLQYFVCQHACLTYTLNCQRNWTGF